MTNILALVNLALTLLNSLVQWGARAKLFKEAEAIIAGQVLSQALKDIEATSRAKEILDNQFTNDPTIIVQPDKITRSTKTTDG